MKAHRLVIMFVAVASVAAVIGAGAAATDGTPAWSRRSTRGAPHSTSSTVSAMTRGDARSRRLARIGSRRSRLEATR